MTIIRSNTFNYYINQENVLFKVYNDALEADRKEKEEKVKKQSRIPRYNQSYESPK